MKGQQVGTVREGVVRRTRGSGEAHEPKGATRERGRGRPCDTRARMRHGREGVRARSRKTRRAGRGGDNDDGLTGMLLPLLLLLLLLLPPLLLLLRLRRSGFASIVLRLLLLRHLLVQTAETQVSFWSARPTAGGR
jgi:hypothetical protein